MNQEGMDVLIQAGLAGHPQDYGRFHGLHGSHKDCAWGVLHLTMHATRKEVYKCLRRGFRCFAELLTRYDITVKEYKKIIALNDQDHLDFIGIAWKLEGYTER